MLVGIVMLALAAGPSIAPAVPGTQDGVDVLSFMTGCWRGPIEGGFMEEIYTETADNLMLGTTRTVRGDTVVSFELTRIERRKDGIFLAPYPNGQPSPDPFRLTQITGDEALFEAPEHDFPRRIRYRRQADGSLQARIDDGNDDGRAMEWTMAPGPCPGRG